MSKSRRLADAKGLRGETFATEPGEPAVSICQARVDDLVEHVVEVGRERVDVEVPGRVLAGGGSAASDLFGRPGDLTDGAGEQVGSALSTTQPPPAASTMRATSDPRSTAASTGRPYIMKFMSFEGMLNSSPLVLLGDQRDRRAVQLVLEPLAGDQAEPSPPGPCGSPARASRRGDAAAGDHEPDVGG